MFVNCTNHVSKDWSKEQRESAEAYGEIMDYSFPNVPADADEEWIERAAEVAKNNIVLAEPKAVLVQGEMTLTYALVKKLKGEGITCLSACSERACEESKAPDGSTIRKQVFKFVKFREYK